MRSSLSVGYVYSGMMIRVEFDVEGEYEFHFAHDAHGSVYLDGKEIIRGAFDDKVGVSEAPWATFA